MILFLTGLIGVLEKFPITLLIIGLYFPEFGSLVVRIGTNLVVANIISAILCFFVLCFSSTSFLCITSKLDNIMLFFFNGTLYFFEFSFLPFFELNLFGLINSTFTLYLTVMLSFSVRSFISFTYF